MKWEDLRRSQNVEDRRGQNSSPFNRRRPGGSYRMPGGSGGLGGGGLFGLIRLLLMLPGTVSYTHLTLPTICSV